VVPRRAAAAIADRRAGEDEIDLIESDLIGAVPLAKGVTGIDRYQADHFVVYRDESAAHIYGGYTPLEVRYRPGGGPTNWTRSR